MRDPVSKDLFPFFFSNAENSFKYQRDLRQAQLRIAYIILYHVGLRINEIRELTQQDIKDARKSYQFNIIHHKTSKSNIYVLSKKAVKDLNQLDNEFNIIFEKYKYKYLFGKNKPIINKSLIRIINQDLKYTSQLLELPYNIKSHSFRVNMITNLLKVTSVQNTANIIGHSDIRSTMIYNRYALSKNQIQDLLEIMETKTDKSISIKNNID